MKMFDVNLQFTFNRDITREQFEEWFKFAIDWGSCSGDNPLIETELGDAVSTYNITEW